MKQTRILLMALSILCSTMKSAQKVPYKLPVVGEVTPLYVGIATVGIVAAYTGYKGYKRCMFAYRERAFIESTTKKHDLITQLLHQEPNLLNKQYGEMQETVLHGAVRNKDSFTVKLLLGLGADFSLKNKNGQTAAELAVISEDEQMMLLFFAKGYDKQTKVQWDFEKAICDGDRIKATDAVNADADVNRGWRGTMKGTLLHRMVHQRAIESVELLLELGVDSTILDVNGNTAENLLVACKDSRGKAILRMLQKHRQEKEVASKESEAEQESETESEDIYQAPFELHHEDEFSESE